MEPTITFTSFPDTHCPISAHNCIPLRFDTQNVVGLPSMASFTITIAPFTTAPSSITIAGVTFLIPDDIAWVDSDAASTTLAIVDTLNNNYYLSNLFQFSIFGGIVQAQSYEPVTIENYTFSVSGLYATINYPFIPAATTTDLVLTVDGVASPLTPSLNANDMADWPAIQDEINAIMGDPASAFITVDNLIVSIDLYSVPENPTSIVLTGLNFTATTTIINTTKITYENGSPGDIEPVDIELCVWECTDGVRTKKVTTLSKPIVTATTAFDLRDALAGLLHCQYYDTPALHYTNDTICKELCIAYALLELESCGSMYTNSGVSEPFKVVNSAYPFLSSPQFEQFCATSGPIFINDTLDDDNKDVELCASTPLTLTYYWGDWGDWAVRALRIGFYDAQGNLLFNATLPLGKNGPFFNLEWGLDQLVDLGIVPAAIAAQTTQYQAYIIGTMPQGGIISDTAIVNVKPACDKCLAFQFLGQHGAFESIELVRVTEKTIENSYEEICLPVSCTQIDTRSGSGEGIYNGGLAAVNLETQDKYKAKYELSRVCENAFFESFVRSPFILTRVNGLTYRVLIDSAEYNTYTDFSRKSYGSITYKLGKINNQQSC